VVITVIGSLIAGVSSIFNPVKIFWLLVMTVLTSSAFVCMMSMIMARVNDPLIPRAIFGVLNTLLYFPSGAIYPVAAFPGWLRVLAIADPFTYAVHGFKSLLLKEAGFTAIWQDIAYLTIFTIVTLAGTTVLFKRTL
jgi:ABC-2 type transport system permease protein